MGSSLSSVLVPPQIEGSEHWLSPADLLSQLEIGPGMAVADIGAGPGYYALPIRRAVGLSGTVFGVEWRPWIVDEFRLRLEGEDGIVLVAGRPAHTHLPGGSCDLVLLADIWHELESPEEVLAECRRILKPNGRLVILSWHPRGLFPPGPPIEHRISLRRALCTVEMQSWSLVKSRDFAREGYLLIFEITDESVQS